MQDYINFGWGTGFAVIMGLILVIVFLYTIVKLRKQAAAAKEEQRKKEISNPEAGEKES